MPRPGVDYPRSLQELLVWFPDEQACLSYLEKLRWGRSVHMSTLWNSRRRVVGGAAWAAYV
jgi:hypothetical protein